MASSVFAACGDSSVSPHPARAGAALAAKGPSGSPSIYVTSTIFDQDASGNQWLMRSDDFNGSGFATYTSNSTHGGSLTSWITTTGGWQLLLDSQTTRTIYLVLASQGMTGIPDGDYSANVEVYTRCFDANGNKVTIVGLAGGASNNNCTFGMDFSTGGNKYKLALGPDYDAAAPTGRATVTCTAASNGSCTSWTVAPNPSTTSTFTLTNGQVVSAPAANLYVFAHNGLTFKGSYHNSFAISLTE
jgi:hypothetical protein